MQAALQEHAGNFQINLDPNAKTITYEDEDESPRRVITQSVSNDPEGPTAGQSRLH